jgi:two-component system, cell cycle response regulator
MAPQRTIGAIGMWDAHMATLGRVDGCAPLMPRRHGADESRMGSEQMPSRAVRLAFGALAAMLAVFVARALTGFGGPIGDAIEQWGSAAIMLGAAGVCAWRVQALTAERSAWAFIGAGIAVSALGNVAVALLYGPEDALPLPSIADGCWLAFYPLTYVGLVLLARRHAGSASVGLWLDGLIGALACGALGAQLVLDPFRSAASGQPLDAALTILAYPLGDLTLLAMAVGMAIAVGRRHLAAVHLLIAGIIVYTIADGVHLLQAVHDDYAVGGPLDALWLAGILLLAAAAVVPPRPGAIRASSDRSAPTRAIPVAAAVLALAVLTLQPLVRYEVVALALAVAALALTIARMSVSLRENADLLDLREREAVADALTGLGNRRRLVADLAAAAATASDDRPQLLVLFDLDGFKAYNDTFGHGAGDALLSRIAARLDAAVGARGRAYRMGGDEFCALLDPGGAAPEDVAAELAETMREHGLGFDVSASHGCALLPRRGRDPGALLRIADDEMYVRKASRRPGAERQVEDALLTALRERDRELGDQAIGVAGLALAVGRELAVSATELRALEHAAALHDVGKLAIPETILAKPGPLDADERAFVETHPLIAQRIISAAPALRYAAGLVRSSQERWDGAGYPDGLRGEEIPLSSRIIAVCRGYEAIASERARPRPRTAEAAIAELGRSAGSRFDPAVVAALAAVLCSPVPHTLGSRDTAREP